MDVRSKTVADAIQLVENLQKDFELHRTDHKELAAFTRELETRVVNTEKAQIRTRGRYALMNQKLDAIMLRLDNKRIGWQIWVPFGFTALLSLATFIVSVWPKGATS